MSLNANGGLHQEVHLNYQDVRAVDTSGNVYTVQENENAAFNQNKEQTVFHSTITGRIIGKGPAANTKVIILLQTVIDEDGIKTEVSHIDTKCPGQG